MTETLGDAAPFVAEILTMLGTMNILLTLAMHAGVQIRCELSCYFRIFGMVFVAVGHV